MKKVLKIRSFFFLSIILMLNVPYNNICGEIYSRNTYYAINDDTINFSRLIEINPFRLKIIPPSSGVQFYKDGIVFLSMSTYENKMTPDQISFGAAEAYYASIKDSVTGRHMIFSSISPFSYPCEAITFSKNYDTVLFTIIIQKDKKEKICMAKHGTVGKNKEGWITDMIPLDFCNDNYNYSHPALSHDDKMIVFASDREGSLGGMDLFVSRLVNGKWSKPENLGKSINTHGNEFYPFLDSDDNLFFSSDGLTGNGGYDIFTCKFNGSGWDKPRNLSDHINSKDDDIAFTINKMDGKTAFFTRRAKSGKDEAQLFRVTLRRGLENKNQLNLVYVFNGNPVPMSNFIASANKEVLQIATRNTKSKSDTESVKNDSAKIYKKINTPVIIPQKVAVVKPDTVTKARIAKEVQIEPTNKPLSEQRDIVVYRVQLLPNANQKDSKEMVINGVSYKIYEYLYKGAYRYTIGEFSTLSAAVTLQNICRRSGYTQSFVVAFKNNSRSLDMNLFK